MTTIKKSCCWPPRRIEPARGAFDGNSPTKLGKFDNATSSTPRDASDLKRPKTSQDLEVKLLAMLKANKTDSAILNQDTLWMLYHTDQNKGGTEIEEFVSSRIFFNKDNKEKNDPKVVADCNGADPLCELSEVGVFIADTLNDDKLNPFKTHKLHKRVSGEINHNTPRSEDENNEDILHLFLFAILFNRKELAEIAWARCKDHIGAALIASSLLKELSKIAKMAAEFDIAEEISKVSEKYEHKAYEVLTLCYKSNHGKAHDLLIRKLDKPFESTTLLDIAYANNMWNFMSHTCCQTKLNLIWRGNIAIFTQSWKIFLAIFVPLVVFCIKFRGTENEKMSDAPEGINPNTIKVRTEHSNKTTYTVHGCDNEAKRAIGLIKAWKYVYTAPISVFVLNSVSYVVFLGLFAYFVCVDLNENMTITEWAVWGWSFTMLCEEFRQMRYSGRKTVWANTRKWFASKWNMFDAFNYALFIITIILRTMLTGKQFDIVRYFYSFTVAMFSLRSLQNFLVDKNIGPKVIMIRKMMIDLFIFLSILAVFLFSIGVIYQASLFPNSPATPKLLESIIYIPYWQLFGEITLGYLEGDDIDNCTRDESIWRPAGGVGRCPEHKPLVPFLGAVYMFLTNILLVNLLIAMFSNTFQEIQDRSERIWKFYLFNIIREYSERPVVAPPFIILIHIYRVVRHVFGGENGKKEEPNEFKLDATPKYLDDLVTFETTQTRKFIQKAKDETSTHENSPRGNEQVEEMAYESNIKYRRVHVANETIVTSGNNEDIDDLSHNPIGRDIKLRTTKSTLDTSDEMESTLSETNFTTELASILASALAQDVHDLMILFKHSGVEFTGAREQHITRTVTFVDETGRANNTLQQTQSSTTSFEKQLATKMASAIANHSESIQELRRLFQQQHA